MKPLAGISSLRAARLLPVPALLCCAASAASVAKEPAAALPELLGAGYLLQVFGSLLLVFCCLFGLLYAMRRINRMGGVAGVPLRILGSASVGAREKVVLLEAGGKQLLIGVAAGSVRTLHCFAEPIVAAESSDSTPSFAAALKAATVAAAGIKR
ncbi:MAG: flagellar protein FliO/FliZ [Halieaceae bacterium]